MTWPQQECKFRKNEFNFLYRYRHNATLHVRHAMIPHFSALADMIIHILTQVFESNDLMIHIIRKHYKSE